MRVPAPGAVVIGELSPATRSRLEKTTSAPLETPSGAGDTVVIEGGAPDPRSFWEEINKIVGDEALVAPLLSDDEGHRLVPTGRLQARFKSEPSDDELAAFADRHGLTLSKRNAWSPAQAEFSIRPEDGRYPPDIVDRIAADTNVRAVWPDVRAAYKRESAR
jgi:hypothetical protein